jgi:hypothetical protein
MQKELIAGLKTTISSGNLSKCCSGYISAKKTLDINGE